MATYTGTIPSPRTPEQVFDYMAAFHNVTEWDPTAVEAKQVSGEGGGPDARFDVLVKWLGREIPLTYETVVYERPHRVVLRAENKGSVSEDTITVRPAGDGAEMTYEAKVTLKGPMRVIDPLFGLAFRRLGDNAADGLRRVLG